MRPPGQVGLAFEGAFLPGLKDPLGRLAQTAHLGQADADGEGGVNVHGNDLARGKRVRTPGSVAACGGGPPLHRGIEEGVVDRGGKDPHSVAARVLHQRRWRVEAHRLGGQDCRVKVLGRMNLQPRGRIDDVRKRKGVGLREAKVRKPFKLAEDALPSRGVDPTRRHPRHEVRPECFHPFTAALGAHGAAELVSLGAGQPRCVRCDAHQLLLKQRDPQGLSQGRFEEWVQVCHRFAPRATAQVGVDRTPLYGTRPYEGDLDDDVIEAPRLEPGQGVHLRARFHLEDAHRVSGAQQVVHARILLGERVQAEGHLLPSE